LISAIHSTDYHFAPSQLSPLRCKTTGGYDADVKLSLRALLIAFVVLLLAAAAWLWWEHPQRAEMATYVPQDALVYLEFDSLPEILRDVTSTSAWHTLAPAAGLHGDTARLGWLAGFAKWTGIGSAESVIYSRAQVAVAVLGVDAKEEREGSLRVSPRLVIIVETHTDEARVRKVVEKDVGDFARRNYVDPKFEREEREGVPYFIWTAPSGDRKIVVAVDESVAYVGNDDAAVKACLAVRRGERASLANDPELATMRKRVRADDALAFGYVPQSGAPKLALIAAVMFGGQSATDAKEQSALAVVVPQLASHLLGGAAWSTRITNDTVEDDYFFSLPSDVTRRLAVALETSPTASFASANLLPVDARQVSRYSFAEPVETWRGVNAVVSSQLDPALAPLAGVFLENSLKPFGVDSPREFLRAVGPEITTARVGDEGEELLLVAAVRDEATLHALIVKRLGGKARVEHVGGAEMIVSADAELGAASLIEHYVILGSEEGVRRCLEARAAGRVLGATENFKKPLATIGSDTTPLALTLTDEREGASRFISLVARRNPANSATPDALNLARAVASLPYTVSATRLATDGAERKTVSPFGQFANMALQLAPESSAR
jgi:hypothetical protein